MKTKVKNSKIPSADAASEESSYLKRLRLICRKVGIFVRNDVHFVGCTTDKQKVERLKDALKQAGMKGNPLCVFSYVLVYVFVSVLRHVHCLAHEVRAGDLSGSVWSCSGGSLVVETSALRTSFNSQFPCLFYLHAVFLLRWFSLQCGAYREFRTRMVYFKHVI